jgi:hypothetical protein
VDCPGFDRPFLGRCHHHAFCDEECFLEGCDRLDRHAPGDGIRVRHFPAADVGVIVQVFILNLQERDCQEWQPRFYEPENIKNIRTDLERHCEFM